MEPTSPDRNSVDQLAEEFLERYRRGESPMIEEYAARSPEHAEKIRLFFPALIKSEITVPEQDRNGPSADGDSRAHDSCAVTCLPAEPAEGGATLSADSAMTESIAHTPSVPGYEIIAELGRGGMG